MWQVQQKVSRGGRQPAVHLHTLENCALLQGLKPQPPCHSGCDQRICMLTLAPTQVQRSTAQHIYIKAYHKPVSACGCGSCPKVCAGATRIHIQNLSGRS